MCRCLNASGDITGCVVPSRQGVFSFRHHLPGCVGLHAFVGQRRARDGAALLLQRLPVFGARAHGSMQADPSMSAHSGCLNSVSLGMVP